nr:MULTISPECIES: TRAP transporter small permease [unclassified Paenibacillus]
MIITLSSMAILVFGNVIMRYAFNYGITWSEEISRFLFIWLIFIGSIGALKDNEHLGVDSLVKKLPPMGKKMVYVASNLLMLCGLYILFDGAWRMTLVSKEVLAPATGLPLSYIYGLGVVVSVGMTIVLLINLYRALFVRHAIDELTKKLESEEEILSASVPRDPHVQRSEKA